MIAAGTKTFKALSVRNFRLYFIGQLISLSGTWMQAMAQAWLVLKLTGSGVDLGFVVALQFLPMLVAGSWGGLIVDRTSKRNLLFVTQAVAAVLAGVLGLLTLTGHVQLWQILVMAFLLGVVNLFDNPARQAFVQEMVGRDLLSNAVSLNSVLVNLGRVIGPATAGAVIALLGIPACFFINAGTFVAVIVALAMMRTAELTPIRTVARAKGQLRQGFRYAFGDETIRDVLLAVVTVGIFAFNFTVSLPLLVRITFHGSAGAYGALLAAMGGGAVLGGLVIAHRSRPSIPLLAGLCLSFGLVMVAVASSPSLVVATLLAIPMGAASITFISTANATLQLTSKEEMRGRVMALFAIGFLGSTPIGAPLIGWICTATSPRTGIMVGGLATVAAGIPLMLSARRRAARGENPSPLRVA